MTSTPRRGSAGYPHFFYCPRCTLPRAQNDKLVHSDQLCMHCAAQGSPVRRQDPTYGDHASDIVICMLGHHEVEHKEIDPASRMSLLPYCTSCKEEAEKTQDNTAAGTESLSKNVVQYHAVDLKNFPEDFKTRKDSPAYPDTAGNLSMQHVVQDYRGNDAKPFRVKNVTAHAKKGEAGRNSDRKVLINKPSSGVLAFRHDIWGFTFGEISTMRETKNPLVEIAYSNNTQTPHIHIKLRHVDFDRQNTLPPIEVFIYSNALEALGGPEQNPSLHSLQMNVGSDVKTEYIPPEVLSNKSTGVAAAHETGELWLTRVALYSSKQTGPPEEQLGLSGPRYTDLPFKYAVTEECSEVQPAEVTQPVFSKNNSGIKLIGISAAAIDRIRTKAQSQEGWNSLKDVEIVIWWLLQPLFELYIHTWTPRENVAMAKGFINSFRPLMKMSLDHGPYWFYRLAANSTKKFSDRDFPYKSLPVPRWMINSWTIGLNEDNVPVAGTEEALSWANFRIPAVAPSPDAQLFQYRLAMTRETEEHQRRIRESRLKTDFNIITRFKKFMDQPDKFLVAIWLEGHGPMVAPSKLPSLESRISISVRIGMKDMIFKGTTCDDYFNTRCHIFACVRGIQTGALEEDTNYRGFITLVDDEVPTSRMLSGLYLCARPKKINKGVDVGALLGFNEPTVVHTNFLAQEFRQKKEMRSTFRTVLSRIKLDKHQKSAAESATRSATGITALWGPPGTGKTTTNVAMSEALAQCGKVVGYTTPSNVARDVAMTSFLKVTELADDQIVRFKGSYQVGPLQIDQGGAEQLPEDQELLNDVWEFYERRKKTGFDDQLSRYDFETQLENFIDGMRNDPTHDLHAKAKDYFQKKQELADAKTRGVDTRSVRKLRDAIAQVRKLTFTGAYFKSRVKIFFLTESQCAADPIFLYAKVQCLIVDEAGMSAIPGLAVPLGVFKESLELLVLSGHHKQQPPVLVSDVSSNILHSREVFSTRKNETSQANEFEAEFLVRVILSLLEFTPSDLVGNRTVVPSDFLVVTPYSGQRQLIVEKLIKAHKQGIRGQDGTSLLSIPVVTTAAAQGGEGRIVLVSLVANKPGAPRSLGSIVSPTQLIVETSRAKEFLFIFGNFKGWVNLIRGRDPVFVHRNYNGDSGHFINLVHDVYNQDQIIDCDNLCDSLNGITITDSTFLSTLDPCAPKEQGTKKRKHADIDDPTTAPEASASEQGHQPVKKKSRESRKRKESDAKGRQDGQSSQAA
ncbi:Helicase with zinc finger domain 2 [Lasiodiplodia theobromae]|uniref:Helicase with zinc finger domain 2 n=1 Tax=Lasiodiplodia theobromae TaxID=45133 RepID=A0A5N5DH03_9PEZI|nr:Helicase with zinc finger domain 2 [Lasiodiplodia theobromae]